MNTAATETNSPTPRRANYMKYLAWAVVIAVCATPVTAVYRVAVDQWRWHECTANLKRIGLALHQYHDRCGSFPPAYVMNEQGERWHSWRVLLLPDLGYADLYAQYRFDEPWNGPHNRELLNDRSQ